MTAELDSALKVDREALIEGFNEEIGKVSLSKLDVEEVGQSETNVKNVVSED